MSATNQKRPRRPILTSPKGIARYPRLGTPDTKFDADGVYKIDLILEGDAATKLGQDIDKAMAASFEEAKKDPANKGKKVKMADAPYGPVTEKQGDEVVEVEGKQKFGFKMKAIGKNSKTKETWKQRPTVFDAKGNPLDATKLKIGGGSEVKVAYEIVPFFTPLVGAGVSLRLKGVQILKLVEFGGSRDASAFGFGSEEDGYDGSEQQGDEPTETPAETAGGDASDESEF